MSGWLEDILFGGLLKSPRNVMFWVSCRKTDDLPCTDIAISGSEWGECVWQESRPGALPSWYNVEVRLLKTPTLNIYLIYEVRSELRSMIVSGPTNGIRVVRKGDHDLINACLPWRSYI